MEISLENLQVDIGTLMVNIHMQYQGSRSSLLSRFTSITKITLKKKKQQTSQSKFTLSTFYCDFLLFRSALCPKRTKHSAIFTEKWKTFQSRLTLGPTVPFPPLSPCKPGGPYILTKIFVSSVKTLKTVPCSAAHTRLGQIRECLPREKIPCP